MMNTKLNLNEKVSIIFKNDYNTSYHGTPLVAVESLEINNTKYFNDIYDKIHLTIRGFIKDIIVDDFRDEIKQNNESIISDDEVNTFFNYFRSTINEYKLDIGLYSQSNIDCLYNDLFTAYQDNIKYDINYNFDRLFSGKLGLSKDSNFLDLETMKLDKQWITKNTYTIKCILKILNHLMADKDSLLSKMAIEFLELDKYLSTKKTVRINGKKHEANYLFSIIRALLNTNTKTKVIQYAKEQYKLNYIQEINHYLRV